MSTIAVKASQIQGSIDLSIVKDKMDSVRKNGHTMIVLLPFKETPFSRRLLEVVDLHKWLLDHNIPYDHLGQEPEWDELLQIVTSDSDKCGYALE